MLINKTTIASQLAPPLDAQLASDLVEEFVSQEKRFVQRDWEPSQLDGGQFCEILARIVYHQDSGNLNRGKSFQECMDYVEHEPNAHAIKPRRDALHLCKVLRMIWKFRSERGAVHISPNYKANHMDSKLLLENVRWAFSETLRIFWKNDMEMVAATIRELLQFEIPAIGKFDDVLMVQRTDLSPAQEILLLLHYAGDEGFSRSDLGKYVQHPSQRISDALKMLTAPACRQVAQLGNKKYRLTDLGSNEVRDKLSAKLVLG